MSWRALAGRAILTFRVISSGDHYKEEMPFGEARRFASTPLIRASLPSGAHGASRLRHAGGYSHAAPERSGDRRESPRGTRGGARGRLPSVLQPPHVATKGADGNLPAQAANGLAARRERRGVRAPFPRSAPQTRIVPELEPLESEAVFDKIAMSAFEGTFLNTALRDLGID